jgi:hypothetical protein
MAQENKKLRLLRTIVRRRYKRIEIDPDNVGYIQYPEFRDSHRILARPKTRNLAGDWDQTINQEIFWCSVYEPAAEHVRGMVSLGNYVFYRSLEAHFNDGESWQATRWYRWMIDRQQNNPIRRYRTPDEVAERLDFLDKLHSDFRSGLYRDDPVDRPIINIGRDGRMAVEDGRHRLCVARVAGLREYLVDVNVVHADISLNSI